MSQNQSSDRQENDQVNDQPNDERREIQEKVRLLVAEAVGRPPATVTLESSLTEELGADSLSLLDLVFTLERTFSIQITRGEIERTARGDMTDDEFAPGGVISEAGLERLRALMPEAAGRIVPGLRPIQVITLFSARTFAAIVLAKRAQVADAAPGATVALSPPSGG